MGWMVTGGAGYIGSHVVAALRASGRDVVVLDDLSSGRAGRVPAGVPLVVADVADAAAVAAAMRGHAVTGVVHLAARKSVPESVADPVGYYRANAGGLQVLLEQAVAAGVGAFVFSSSAAVYGEPEQRRVTEATPCAPISPYGQTKLVGEWMVAAAGAAHALRWLALRYFNVAGAGAPALADTGRENLVPLLLDAAARGVPATVFGNDYDTPDGTCVRDYVHVVDVAEAHVAAVDRCEAGPCGAAVNLGTGRGSSVLEVVAAVSRARGEELPYAVGPRRPGDPAELVAEVGLAGDLLGWSSRLDLDAMASSAAAAWQG